MSIINAIKFIERVPADADFRASCYRCRGGAELTEYLVSEGFKFDEEEFENACNMLHMKCADESAAYELHEIKSWYKLFGVM
ncbi:MAG: Nif11-like leader peptide family natural product precursor [Rikenellaceae bacterium]